MSSKDNPCHNCPNRVNPTKTDNGCRSYCEEYKEYQAEHQRQKEAYRQWKQADYLQNGYEKVKHARLNRVRKNKND